MSTTPPLPAHVLDALRRGDANEAIQLLRNSAGIGLKEAKAIVATQGGRAPRGPATSPAGKPLAAPMSAPVFSTGLPVLVIEALQRGEKLQAIRLMREITGVGLKEAKDAVEASPHAAARGGLSPGEVPRTGRLVWGVIAAVLVAVAVFLSLRSPG
ncbi:MAG: ribosomal protein L7/L12 [Caldimonas sp.]